VNLIEYGTPTVPAGHVFVCSPAMFGQVSSEMPPAGTAGTTVRTATIETIKRTSRAMVRFSSRCPMVLQRD